MPSVSPCSPNFSSKNNVIAPGLKDFIIDKARSLCAENEAKLVYLTLYGSTLYGTRVPGKSDVDVRGLFLPSAESLILEEAPKSLRFSTGEGGKNTCEDVDIDLWSLRYWLSKLLPAGDTGALDVLFSPSRKACTLCRDAMLDPIFSAPLRFIDTVHGRTYVEYSVKQAKKYGIKGSRLGALRAVAAFLRERCPHPGPQERFSDYLQALIETCGDGRFCTQQEINGRPALRLCGKLYDGTIRMTEFLHRIETAVERFGVRAQEAEQNQGLDFKALSHALRAIMQMEELLTTGNVRFPLKGRQELIAVKEGRLTRDEIETRILKRLEAVDALYETTPFHGVPDAEFARSCLLSCYGMRRRAAPASPHDKSVFAEGFDVGESTLEAIQLRLDAAEARHEVRILYACESGSRGWNFASQDSDFDVRFIYLHRRDWYLCVAPGEKPDTLDLGLENTPVGELDINGWELRKALKLFHRSNVSLLEWLSSPLVYREKGSTIQQLRELARNCFIPTAAWHHYRGLMKRSRARYETDSPSIKTWFYTFRPLLCMRWIKLGLGVPPMRFDRVMEGVLADRALKDEIYDLIRMKRCRNEWEHFTASPSLERCMNDLLRESVEPPAPVGRKKMDLDAIFRDALDFARGEK
ncbi:MAG: nucleotidyltransferase domain-containing protein [Synergistaceae bacterium]|nr:nucleotidyltransferase domain-containing protein [Synergistaceae bacterium]